jgi:hypothetical protein
MPDPNQLSVATTIALILGGIAAFALALAIALGGYGRGGKGSMASSARPTPSVAPGASSEAPGDEIEFPLETSEPLPATSGR